MLPDGPSEVVVGHRSSVIGHPSSVANHLRSSLGFPQFSQFLCVKGTPRPITQVFNFIVAANHSSHLDMGLTKMALGEAGKDMVVLAAADYFFDTKYKRAVMENFTNLVPMERTGSLRQSLRHASSFLDRGYNALIFPEGTRSVTGEMADFKPVVGYLALHARVGILPVYLHGTHDAMPKGSNIIKSRKIGARIGRYLEIADLEKMSEGLPRAEAYRLIAALVKHEVENLRDRTRRPFDAKELRKLWKAERRAQMVGDRRRMTDDRRPMTNNDF